jgi:uncharacterized membrane protein YphA (DoxX/SURF4 family)
MKKILSNKYLLLAFRILIAFVFIFSGAQKITDPGGFSDAITNYKLFPIFSVNFIAIFIPWLELFTGVLILFGCWIRENIAVVNVLLTLFIIIIAVALFRGLNISCGCFGTKNVQKVGIVKIGENFLLMTISYILYRFGGENKKNEDRNA